MIQNTILPAQLVLPGGLFIVLIFLPRTDHLVSSLTLSGHTTTFMFGYDSKMEPSTASFWRQNASETIERGLNYIIR